MSEKSDRIGGDVLESQSDASASTAAEERKVGPGRPPQDTRWKKGCKSPNPKGRPRKDRSSGLDLKKALEQALNEKVSVRRGDRIVSMTKGELGIQQLVNQYIQGDPRARRDLKDYAAEHDIDIWARHRSAIEEALAPKDQEILDAYVKRHSAKDLAPADRVLAPSELLDDDEPAKSETDFQLPPEPQAKLEIPEPTPIPGNTYPKPFRQMTPLQRRAWYPEWWEKYGQAWEKRRVEAQKAAPPLDQASVGRGSPPPGGRSLTTGKWT